MLQKKATESPSLFKKFTDHHLAVIFNHHFLVSTLALGLGTILWLLSLSKVDLSIANPFMSLSYILVMVLSKIFFDEEIPNKRWIGISLVILGIIFISSSK